ncbi:MAG: hypothetical protein GY719_26135 [bacterium]|nr:hypothetical protein [bacterium]
MLSADGRAMIDTPDDAVELARQLSELNPGQRAAYLRGVAGLDGKVHPLDLAAAAIVLLARELAGAERDLMLGDDFEPVGRRP